MERNMEGNMGPMPQPRFILALEFDYGQHMKHAHK